MLAGEGVHEGLYESASGEVEDKAKGDADWESGKRFLEDGEEEKSEAKANQDGDETGQRRVPITVGRRLSHQHAGGRGKKVQDSGGE